MDPAGRLGAPNSSVAWHRAVTLRPCTDLVTYPASAGQLLDHTLVVTRNQNSERMASSRPRDRDWRSSGGSTIDRFPIWVLYSRQVPLRQCRDPVLGVRHCRELLQRWRCTMNTPLPPRREHSAARAWARWGRPRAQVSDGPAADFASREDPLTDCLSSGPWPFQIQIIKCHSVFSRLHYRRLLVLVQREFGCQSRLPLSALTSRAWE